MTRRGRRGVLLVALAALWVTLLTLAFVAQTTELFGAHNGLYELLLLGAGGLVFIAIGSVGIGLALSWLERDEQRSGDER